MKYQNIFVPTILIIALVSIFLLFGNSLDSQDQTNSASGSSEYMHNYNVYALELPQEIHFAGESAPLKRWYVKEALDRELLVNTYWQSQTLLLIKRANRFLPTIIKILKEESVPEDLKYIAVIESGLMPTIVSPAGATGIWQFMKTTGKEYGLEINSEVDERYHIEKATRAACQYLKNSKKLLGNWTLAAAAYNAGDTGIQKQLERQDASNYYDLLLNPETGRYIYRILAIKMILENPQKYGFKFNEQNLYKSIPTERILVEQPIENLGVWAKQNGINYPILKELNPWLRQNHLNNKHQKTYYIKIPKQGYADFQYSSYQK